MFLKLKLSPAGQLKHLWHSFLQRITIWKNKKTTTLIHQRPGKKSQGEDFDLHSSGIDDLNDDEDDDLNESEDDEDENEGLGDGKMGRSRDSDLEQK